MDRHFPENWDYDRWRASVQHWSDYRMSDDDVDRHGGRHMYDQGMDPHTAMHEIRPFLQRELNLLRPDLYPFCGVTAEMFCFPASAIIAAHERCTEPERPTLGCCQCPFLLYAVKDGPRRYQWVTVDERGRITRQDRTAGTRLHRQACGIVVRRQLVEKAEA